MKYYSTTYWDTREKASVKQLVGKVLVIDEETGNSTYYNRAGYYWGYNKERRGSELIASDITEFGYVLSTKEAVEQILGYKLETAKALLV